MIRPVWPTCGSMAVNFRFKAGTEVSFTHQLSTDADELEFIAGDILGNNTTARISLTGLSADDDTR